ncbi:MAG: GNAT family N-acetyltransferase [Sphingomonadales bacterium]|nr:GNAT family N-acetyltransferase [Sphingomonadales bacterium]
MSLRVVPLAGAALAAAIPDLARLRIAVFAEFPYLYAGSLDYEQTYLAAFAAARHAVLIAAIDGDRIVGGATASPLAVQDRAVQQPFERAGIDRADVFYFGESVLLPAYRGRGLGHAFFDHREAAARQAGAKRASFCAVLRPVDHPARPADYRPLDRFWQRRGYAAVPGMTGQMAWQEHGEHGESPKPMQFWMREL